MKIQWKLSLILILIFLKSSYADEKNTNGADIYKEVCSICHTSGVTNAPKIGDQLAWKKLIDEGQVIITVHGYVRVRAMPPRGGREELSVERFSEALNYMVDNSGGQWNSPDKWMQMEINKEITKRKNTQ